jgi:uncharacterized membrane protein YoaK (UPF0700 family)
MLRHRRSEIALAVSLSALAGYVDAIGFLSLGGFFVSFMSGNSTRLAVGIAGAPEEAFIAIRIIACFLLGVIVGSLLGHFAKRRRRPVVLALVAGGLALAAGLAGMGWPQVAMLFAAAAMGAENTTFERDGEVTIGLTYMTGTLVKVGQRIAGALTGGPALAWTPYALLWLGLAAGAVLGAFVWPHAGLAALWPASLVALLLAAAAWMMEGKSA